MLFHKAILPLAVFCLAATPALAAKIDLSGQVTYRERIALPENSILGIELVDETLPAAPPRVAVKGAIGPGQVPLSFDLTFEDSLILPNHDYALIATISTGGRLLFRNFEPYPVTPLTPAAKPILIVTSLVAQADHPSSSSAEPQAPVAPAILDTLWTAKSINGTSPLPRTNATLSIGSDLRAGGSGGCNSWFAQAQLDGDRLGFATIGATQKGCTQNVNLQEQAYFAALAATATWQVSGDMLTLFGVDGKPLVVFEH